MTDLTKIISKLKQECPTYKYKLFRGLFEKYIAIISSNKIIFTVWVDKKSGYKELLDEINFYQNDWMEQTCKTRLFHWSKFRKLPRNIGPRYIIEKIELNSEERKLLREKIEHCLENMHIE